MDNVYGLDISSDVSASNNNIVIANLAVDRIPFQDNYFDSVSAYDFLEHVPRAIYLPDNNTMYFSFVELMNEVWRVLKNGGLFYASTPVYPSQEAFVDPTHLNYLTDRTHIYFTRPHCMAEMYGFTGCFDVVRVKRIRPFYDFEPYRYTFGQKFKKMKDVLKKRNTYILWELSAIK
jgi:SAM-dependent methyltransferase